MKLLGLESIREAIRNRANGFVPGFRGAVMLLCWEASFAMAYETWFGVTYLAGLAGEMNLSVGSMMWLASLPFIGQVGQLFGFWFLHRVTCVKQYTMTVAALSRAVWVIPLLTAWLWGTKRILLDTPFPTSTWFGIMAAVATLSAVLAQSSSMTWLTWVVLLVPGKVRGRFFGLRQRYVMGALVVANGIGAAFLSWKPGGLYAGYFLVACLGLLAAGISSYLLWHVPAPKQAGARVEPPRLSAFLEPFQDHGFRRVLMAGGVFNAALQVSSPYFAYYFTRDLHIPMSHIAAWTLLFNLGCFAASAFWGKRVDRRGAGGVAILAAYAMALSPLVYAIPLAGWVNGIGPVEYFTNGLFQAGYTLAIYTLQLGSLPAGRSTLYLSVYYAFSGVCGAAGTLLGGMLLQFMTEISLGFPALAAVSAFIRLAVVRFVVTPCLDRRSDAQRAGERSSLATSSSASTEQSEADAPAGRRAA